MDTEYISLETRYHGEKFHVIDKDPIDRHKKQRPSSPEEVGYETTHPIINRILEKLANKGLCNLFHIREYLLSCCRRNCRPNTIRTKGQSIILFLSFLKNSGIENLETITREEFSAFIEHEQDRGLKPSAVNTRLIALSAFFNFLIEREIISPDVLKRKMHIKMPDSLPRAINPEDVKQLLSVIENPRDRAMVLTLLRTGMRIGELLNTTVADLNLKEKCIEIYEAQKNRVGRVVYISDDAMNALKEWLTHRKSKGPYVFNNPKGGPLCYEVARMVFRKYLDKAGLSNKGYTIHCLRHTFASELLNASMRLECVQVLLGHKSIEMTRRYARLTDATRKEEYFHAMSIIERGGINGHYKCDYQLP